MRKILDKKAAFELSMSTVVIIVLAMTLLVLGLTLIRKIIKMGTGVIDITDAGVRAKLNKILGEEGRDITVGLPDKTAVGRPGGKPFNAPIIVNTQDIIGDPQDLKYIVSLEKDGECIEKNGEKMVESFFKMSTGKSRSFDEWEGNMAYASIDLQIPKTAKLCIQKVYVDIKSGTQDIGRTSFKIEVARGILGL